MCIITGGESTTTTQFSTRVMHVWVCKGWYIHHQTRYNIGLLHTIKIIAKYKEYKNNHQNFVWQLKDYLLL